MLQERVHPSTHVSGCASLDHYVSGLYIYTYAIFLLAFALSNHYCLNSHRYKTCESIMQKVRQNFLALTAYCAFGFVYFNNFTLSFAVLSLSVTTCS